MSTRISDTGNTPQKENANVTTNQSSQPATPAKVNKGGLEGIVAAITAISLVDGTAGRLIYRGYNIHDLATTSTFEEVAHLLWFGHLPNQQELSDLHEKFVAQRDVPEYVLQVIRGLPTNTDPMDALRTAASAWGALKTSGIGGKPDVHQAIAITARLPLFMAAFDRHRHGKEILTSRAELGHAANYLYLLTGELPKNEHVRGLNSYLVLLADHGMNASTFTARIVASTESDIVSSLVAAIGALKGPLHGGAPSKVQDMLREIGSIENSEQWLRDAITQGGRLMGFGHRVYKTKDPRAEELREMARIADPEEFKLSYGVEERALALLEELKPGRRLYTNVEYYSSALMSSIGLSGDLFTPTFAISRSAGWTAHILEQVSNNRLIRPEADYTGPQDLTFVPLTER
ncbi:citrate synthase 1 [Ktedonobacteria bacterium brp13]|nr:citrate synthase 1 [Ktedonobacteria bacterium brp13]